jgi:predicted ATPase/class 3 adenylate cyclase/Flp pilus assembly protein TadD
MRGPLCRCRYKTGNLGLGRHNEVMEQPLPSGTLTLLFSDIEGSTRLLNQLGVQYGEALSVQRSIMRGEFTRWHGREMGTQGDSFFIVFSSVDDAIEAALAAQRRLASYEWPEGAAVRVRMGLHRGEPAVHDNEYVGMDVHRAARIASAAHGGQIVVSGPTAKAIDGRSPELTLKDLGWHRLKDIPEPEHIFQLLADGLTQDFPPLKSLGTPTNLPPFPTPILGRDGELAEITAQFTGAGVRLVTLTGPGGSGKTRLAIAAADRLGSTRADGVYFVPLATATTADVMWSTIAETLGIPGEGRAPPTFFEHIVQRDMLLVLDNLEQLTDAPFVVSELLAHAPHIAILATSRRPLHLTGEYQHPVPPLEIPAQELTATEAGSWGAVALFVHRAQMVRPSFRLSDGNVADVVAICSRLDGMPLAIELAAARMKLLAPHAILSRLDRSLELGSTEFERPTRQRTLRQTIAWSYDLLTADQQRLFRQLGVFGGSCDLDALAAVTQTGADPLDQVADFVDVSLARIVDDRSGEPRLDLLQTVRAFARECLHSTGEWDLTARRHAEHFLALIEDLGPRLRTAEYLGVRDRVEAELDNFRAALEWSLPREGSSDLGDVSTGFRLCRELTWFWYACGYPEEGRRWLERATGRITGEEPEEIAVLHGLGIILLQQGESETARRLFTQCLDYWRARGDDSQTAKELNSLGIAYRYTDDQDKARELFEEGIVLAERSDDNSRLAAVLSNLGILEIDIGAPTSAINRFNQAIRLDRELGDAWAEACDRVNLAAARLHAGQIDDAYQELRDISQPALSVNDVDLTIGLIELLAIVWAEKGDVRQSARLYGTSEAMRGQANLPRPPPDEAHLTRSLAKNRSSVSEAVWSAYVTEGRLLSREEAIAEGIRSSSVGSATT